MFRDGNEWWKYRHVLNKIMLKDLNLNWIKSYNIVINDLLTEWESYDGLVVPHLIEDLYKISISCKHSVILCYLCNNIFITSILCNFQWLVI